MTTLRIVLLILNAFFAGVTVGIAVCQLLDGRTAKIPLALAAINFAAIGIALI